MDRRAAVTAPRSTIAVRGIRAYGRHGADARERDHPQPLDLDLELDVDAHAAIRSDALSDTVDYAALHRSVVAIVATSSYALLEGLAQRIADEVMRNERVLAARITIAKPGGLCGATPAVTITARRDDWR